MGLCRLVGKCTAEVKAGAFFCFFLCVQMPVETNPMSTKKGSGRIASDPKEGSGKTDVAALLDRVLPPVPWSRGGRERQAQGRRMSKGRTEVLLGIIAAVAVLLYSQIRGQPSVGDVASRSTQVQSDYASSALSSAGDPRSLEVIRLTRRGEVHLSNGETVALLGILLPVRDRASAAFRLFAERSGRSPDELSLIGQEVARLAEQLVRGRQVEVEFDPVTPRDLQPPGQPPLVYVWLLREDGRRAGMLNYQLLALGYAEPVLRGSFRHQADFAAAAARARAARVGLWGYDLFRLDFDWTEGEQSVLAVPEASGLSPELQKLLGMPVLEDVTTYHDLSGRRRPSHSQPASE